MNHINVHAAGWCNSRGIGGWAHSMENNKTVSKRAEKTTRNHMELTAVLKAILAHPRRSIRIITPSQYVIDGATKWLPTWKRKNWLTRDGTSVKHRRLWEFIEAALELSSVQFQLVRYGSGDPTYSRVCSSARAQTYTEAPKQPRNVSSAKPAIIIRRSPGQPVRIESSKPKTSYPGRTGTPKVSRVSANAVRSSP